MHTFFIKYYAEGGECFPMEVKPSYINMNDYEIKFDHDKNIVFAIRNKELYSDIVFKDMNL